MAHNWIKMTPDSPIPQLAVIGEKNIDGSPIYVGRSFHEGGTFPARVDSKKHCAYISCGGSQIKKFHYEILVGDNYRFIKYYADGIPLYAVRAGNSADGEPLYVGRGILKGNPIVGRIHRIHQCLFVCFGGEEHSLNSYEFLVCEPMQSSTWVYSELDSIPENAVVAGVVSDRSPIYVGRAYHEGENLPAKVIPEKGYVCVSLNGFEFCKDIFEVLVGDGFSWAQGAHSGDNIPTGAVSTGQTKDGKPIYVGRGLYKDTLTPGKVYPGVYSVDIPCFGKEHKISNYYEILVKKDANNVLKKEISYAHSWNNSELNKIPQNAVVGGVDNDKSLIYVGRADNGGEMLPANVIPNKEGAWVSYGGEAISKDNFELLLGDGYSWVQGAQSGDNIPIGAVSTGQSKDGTTIYVGRGIHHDTLTPGRVHPGIYGVYIPFQGKEQKITCYEILVRN